MAKVTKDLVEYYGISTFKDETQKNFKQMNVDYTFCIPKEKPNIDQLLKVWAETTILSSILLKTPVGTSLEGQVVTGYKLLVTGEINIKIEYIACDYVGSVHTAHTTFPFSGYIVLPADTNPYSIPRVCVIVEDVFSENLDCRCVYNNITMALMSDVC